VHRHREGRRRIALEHPLNQPIYDGRMARILCSALLLTLAHVLPAFAQAPADAPTFIAPAALAAQLKDPALVILHVGDKDAYAKEHIPGARLVTLGMITAAPHPPLQNEMPAPADLEAKLEALGIGDGSRIVVYFAKDEIPQVARVAFTLDYAGLGARTSILDGGLTAWIRGGQPVTADLPPAPGVASLTVRPRAAALVDLAWVRTNLETAGLQLVDARPATSYTGEDDRNGEIKRPGHLPGAASLPYTRFFNDDKTIKSSAELKQLMAEAGIAPGQALVTYCNSGVQASVPFLVARMLGYEAKLYDGSFQEWTATDAPVVKGAAPR
jgi:thiosulfate/3-mercaptopyruvate sulfurtransferase